MMLAAGTSVAARFSEAGLSTAAVLATDAIGAAELAADAVTEIRDAITAVLNNLSAQEVRDAMKLAPTAGVPAGGSVDEHLDDILADTAAIEPVVTANLDVAVSTRAAPGDAMDLVAGAVDAAAVATDAFDADAIAASAVTEIQSGLATASALATAQVDITLIRRLLKNRMEIDTTTGVMTLYADDGITPEMRFAAMSLIAAVLARDSPADRGSSSGAAAT